MEQQAQCSIAANVDFDILDIPDTDPEDTDSLWFTVRMSLASDVSREAPAAEDAPVDDTTTATEPVTKKAKHKSIKPATAKTASIDDIDFESTVLRPRGVIILQKHTDLTYEHPFQHFDTDKAPESGKKAFYQNMHSSEVEVFIDGGSEFEKRVAIEYKTADSWKLNERRFANLAIRYFLLQQLMDMDHDKTEMFLPERMDEENVQPDPAEDWEAFPILAEDGNTKPFGFVLSPDAMYWLSLQAFGINWTLVAINYVHIHHNRVFAPYLSVEYKEDPKDPAGYRKGIHQMTCAAILSQYSRYKLRFRIMKTHQDPIWTDEDSNAIRHYGLTICGAKFDVWLVEAQVAKTGEWLGSNVRRLHHGELKAYGSIRRVVLKRVDGIFRDPLRLSREGVSACAVFGRTRRV